MSDRFGETMQFNSRNADIPDAKSIIMSVYAALKAKGYDPITQIVGYIISGDPNDITSYNNARSMIKRLERDEILEELVRFYVRSNEGKR